MGADYQGGDVLKPCYSCKVSDAKPGLGGRCSICFWVDGVARINKTTPPTPSEIAKEIRLQYRWSCENDETNCFVCSMESSEAIAQHIHEKYILPLEQKIKELEGR